PALRAEPARDGERNGERQRDDPDDNAGDHIPGELLPVVVLEGREKLGDEHGGEKILDSRMHFIASLGLVLSLQQGLPSDSAVHAILLTRVSALPDTGKHGEGIVVGLLDQGRRIVAVGVDADDVFEIGSITKGLTACVLADMVSRREVRLDDPVAKYLPSLAHVPSRNGLQIILLDLATLTAEPPRMAATL